MESDVMSSRDYRFVIFGLIAGIITLALLLVIVSISLKSQRNDLVMQVCDYSRVANVDTVTELCTRFQQQTNTEYYCNLKNECWVK